MKFYTDRPDLTLGVVGAGAMGRGIAQIAAAGGMQVLMMDTRAGVADEACDFIKILRKVDIGVMGAFWAALALGSVAILSPEALAQTYPTKPIRLVVTSAPGSGPDIMARMIGAKLTEALGQHIVVDNRGTTSGRIGTEMAARATADGYTLMMMISDHVSVSSLYTNLSYDLVKDFSPIVWLGATYRILVVTPSVPVTSVRELLTLAKSRPGMLRYGSSGSGTSTHLTTELFNIMAGIEMLHVPYKGGFASIIGTMSGEVDMVFSAIPPVLPLINSGKLRALGVTSSKRTTLAPGLPPISEFVPGYESSGWYGLVAPAKTRPAILSKLNAEVGKILKTSEIRERMKGSGAEPIGGSREDFALHISDQLEKIGRVAKLSGARRETD